jgi:hypothetical protein
MEAIKIRRSRRKYLATPVSGEIISELNSRIAEYNRESGLHIQPVINNGAAFQGIRRSYGMFSNVSNYIVLAGKQDDKDFKEKAGYYGEKLVLDLTQAGLGTCWVGGSFDKKECVVDLRDGEAFDCVIAFGNIDKDVSVKERLIFGAMHMKRKTAKEMCETNGEVPQWFWGGMEAVVRAPSAVNSQPVTFLYDSGKVSARVNDMTQHEPIDMGIAKLHFELGAGGGAWQWGNGGNFNK